MSYRIKTVAGLIGVPRNTLIAWERRYGLVTPGRTPSGHRRYSAHDLRTLQALCALMGQGLRVSEAVEMLRASSPSPESSPSPSPMLERLVTALLNFDQDQASRIWRSTEALSFQSRIYDAVLPGLRALGEGWESGEITVAQEHFASDFFRQQLMAMLLGLDHGPADGPRVVCACPADEQHDLGLMSAAVLLALRGYRIVWLGGSVPETDLLSAVQTRVPQAVCLALAKRWDPAELMLWVRNLRAKLPVAVRLIIGGATTSELVTDAPDGVRFVPGLEGLVEQLQEPTA